MSIYFSGFAALMKQDKFSVVPLERLLRLILEQLKNGQYFGLDKDLFYTGSEPAIQSKRFGQLLETPLGVAAGPHTQMAQNIIGACTVPEYRN